MKMSVVEKYIQQYFPWADPDSGERIEVYLNELGKWNRSINLTGIPQEDWMEKIVVESAVLLKPIMEDNALAKPGAIWVDMGTGAGIPGLIIAALLPSQALFLIDIKQKKIDFLSVVAAKMVLKNVIVLQSRLETISEVYPILKGSVNVFFSRALADIDKLVEYASPLAAPDAVLISPRGRANINNQMRVISGNGESWSGNICNLQIPGYNRDMTCVKLVLESTDND
ncbi:MAG: 16S rRNA (guanine(527)-N(7))-methyltransferase RsmG [bacterium]